MAKLVAEMNDEFSNAIKGLSLNYVAVAADLATETCSIVEKQEFLFNVLPVAWRKKYLQMTKRTPALIQIEYNGFVYYFDDYCNNVIDGLDQKNESVEDRILGVIGKSRPRKIRGKEVGKWLKGFIGPTEMRWGPQFDKGHFVAYSLGGGEQLNIFPQRRDLNRGHGGQKEFRDMEKYCFAHPETLFFHRPIYLDETARPAALDFGVLTTEGELWVKTFDNREIPNQDGNFVNRVPKGKPLNVLPPLS